MQFDRSGIVAGGIVLSMGSLVLAGDIKNGDDIQAAIDDAVAGEVIQIPAGVYPVFQTIDLRGKQIVLQGEIDEAGAPLTTLDGRDSIRIMDCVSGETANTRILNLVLSAGRAFKGGGMRVVDSAPVLENCVFLQNHSEQVCTFCPPGQEAGAADGGAMWIKDGSPTLLNCAFRGNSGLSGGGVWAEGSVLRLQEAEFDGNVASDFGGGIHALESELRVEGGVFSNNNSGETGGAIDFAGTSLDGEDATFIGIRFESNMASSSGGGVSVFSSGEVSFEGVDCLGNESGGRGGALHLVVDGDGSLQILDGELMSNQSVDRGGAVFIKSHIPQEPLVEGCRFEGNITRSQGSAVFYSGDLRIGDSVICGNEVLPQLAPEEGWTDLGGNDISTECEGRSCPADFNGDGIVNGSDLAFLLGEWGSSNPDMDISGNGLVDGADLAYLLGTWGDCS